MNLAEFFAKQQTPGLSSGVHDGVNGGVNDGENGGVNALGESLKQVYDFIHGNPGIKANQLAERLGRSINTIEKQLSQLKLSIAVPQRPAVITPSDPPPTIQVLTAPIHSAFQYTGRPFFALMAIDLFKSVFP